MKKREWNEGMNHLDPDIVEKYTEQKDRIRKKKKQKNILLRFGAIAACFVLIVSAIIVVPMFNRRSDIEPYIPNGEPWTPIINSNVEEVILSADDINGVFDSNMDTNGTNQYMKIYTASPEYLNLLPLPNAEYLPIYSSKKSAPTKSSLQIFIDKYLDAATSFFNISTRTYEIEKDDMWNDDIIYKAEISENNNYILFSAQNNLLYFSYSQFDENGETRLKINGDMVSVLESDTDEQIKEKLKDTIAYVCDSFGKKYTNATIQRYYSYDQLTTIKVYLYTPEEIIFPENFSETPMTSDYIALKFNTDWGRGTICNWGGSKEEAFLSGISLCEITEGWSEYYNVTAKARMLTLEEAEELLKKGYVFGGHSCPLCMAEQPEVDFSDYTYVNIEYVSDENGKICIPFYAFYKYIGKTSDGIGTYARTYVPAIEVNGLDEYFQNQINNHKKTYVTAIETN